MVSCSFNICRIFSNVSPFIPNIADFCLFSFSLVRGLSISFSKNLFLVSLMFLYFSVIYFIGFYSLLLCNYLLIWFNFQPLRMVAQIIDFRSFLSNICIEDCKFPQSTLLAASKILIGQVSFSFISKYFLISLVISGTQVILEDVVKFLNVWEFSTYRFGFDF